MPPETPKPSPYAAMLEQFGLADDDGFEELYCFCLNGASEKFLLEEWQDLLLNLLVAGQDYFGPDWAVSRDLAVLEIGFGMISFAPEAINMETIGEWPRDYAERAFDALEGGLEDFTEFLAAMPPDSEDLFYTLFKGLSYLKKAESDLDAGIAGKAGGTYLTQMHLNRIALSAMAARDSVLKQQLTDGVRNLRLRFAALGRKDPLGPKP